MSWDYVDRKDAGEILAQKAIEAGLDETSLILAIPNGGIAVAAPIAEATGASLSLIIVRKMQIPYNPEAGFGALTSFGTMILNDQLLTRLDLSEQQIEKAKHKTEKQIERRRKAYREFLEDISPKNRHVVLVDDGLASGYTMLAAVRSVKEQNPKSISVFVPTASDSAVDRVEPAVDELICPRIETGFVFAVANAYRDWHDLTDEEVIEILEEFTAN
ncbi:MAG: phosphoribosyltransferase [Candidatus Lokiarchaeota archaeon]|nr:phosphoribosyltransferase [Candidatus Lokiarchaeota archaeon]